MSFLLAIAYLIAGFVVLNIGLEILWNPRTEKVGSIMVDTGIVGVVFFFPIVFVATKWGLWPTWSVAIATLASLAVAGYRRYVRYYYPWHFSFNFNNL